MLDLLSINSIVLGIASGVTVPPLTPSKTTKKSVSGSTGTKRSRPTPDREEGGGTFDPRDIGNLFLTELSKRDDLEGDLLHQASKNADLFSIRLVTKDAKEGGLEYRTLKVDVINVAIADTPNDLPSLRRSLPTIYGA
ncbi:7418_t:CDS:2 [Scutellospora calospora]|uniref:7418_t:CDS:1 n=1 Tax=Scutellospora calospora TaxID=85575 RepID=A0ACA9M9D9_9GLOM|nr:7418_t:CDS:2 [Scutellospora calospora]